MSNRKPTRHQAGGWFPGGEAGEQSPYTTRPVSFRYDKRAKWGKHRKVRPWTRRTK